MERNQQRLIAGLAGALGCALLAIAFLMGRLSARPTEAPGIPASQAAVAAPPSLSVPLPAAANSPASFAPSREINETPVPNTPAIALASPRMESTPISGTITPRQSPSSEQQEIGAYFTQVDRVDDMGAGDPQAFATSLLQSVSSGDFSGFDDLLARSRSQRERLRAIPPPRDCVEHHRLALALSGDSVAMLERLKEALIRGDTTALMTMATEGKTLEGQANRLKAMGETIKRQAGI